MKKACCLCAVVFSALLTPLVGDTIRPKNISRIVTVGAGVDGEGDVAERGAGYRGPGIYGAMFPYLGSSPGLAFPATGPSSFGSYPPPPPPPPPAPPPPPPPQVLPAQESTFPYQHYKPSVAARPYIAAGPPVTAGSAAPVAVTPIEQEVEAHSSDWGASGGGWWNPLLKALVSALGAQLVLKVPVLLLKLLLKKAVIAPAALLAASLPTLWPSLQSYLPPYYYTPPVAYPPAIISVSNGTFPLITIGNTTFPFINGTGFPLVTVVNGTGVTLPNTTGVGGVTTIIIRGRRRRRPTPGSVDPNAANSTPGFRPIPGTPPFLIRRKNRGSEYKDSTS